MKNKYITLLAVVAALIPMSVMAQVDLDKGLVANYSFTGNADDESDNELSGIVHGATLTSDRFGNSNSAYEFDGETSYIDVSFDNKLNLTKDKSISIWYYLPTSKINAQPSLIHLKNASSLYYPTFILQENDDKTYGSNQYKTSFFFGKSTSNYIVSTQQLYKNYIEQWVHLVGTYSQSSGYSKIYFNGVISDSIYVGKITSNSSNADLQIGRYNSDVSTYFKGYLDDLRLYDRAINETEVKALYNMKANNASIELKTRKELKIYPNPTTGIINIPVKETSKVSVYDMKGCLISEQNIDVLNNQINVSLIPTGMYMIHVQEGNQISFAKFIKQ